MVTLEEAGAETIGTLIATIRPDDVRALNHEIDGLIKLGLVRKEETTGTTTEIVLTEQGKAALRK